MAAKRNPKVSEAIRKGIKAMLADGRKEFTVWDFYKHGVSISTLVHRMERVYKMQPLRMEPMVKNKSGYKFIWSLSELEQFEQNYWQPTGVYDANH
jgi:hypothetical protein